MLLEAIQREVNDVVIRFSTYEEGCLWLSGHKTTFLASLDSLKEDVPHWNILNPYATEFLAVPQMQDLQGIAKDYPALWTRIWDDLKKVLETFLDIDFRNLQLGCTSEIYSVREPILTHELVIYHEAGRKSLNILERENLTQFLSPGI
jgi:hypothetical protein